MKKVEIRNQKTKVLLTTNAYLADSFISRAIGLMGRKSIEVDYCLIIEPCNQIHMMNMRFPIDVIYLTAEGIVIDIDQGISPWSFGKKRAKAQLVVESNAGYLSSRVKINDVLVFKQVE